MASTEQGFGPMATRRGLLIAGGAAVSLVALEIPASPKPKPLPRTKERPT